MSWGGRRGRTGALMGGVRLRRRIAGIFFSSALAASCLSPVAPQSRTSPPAQRPASPIGDWVFRIDGGSFADKIEFIEVDTSESSTGAWLFRSFATRSWSDSQVPPLARDTGVGEMLSNGQLLWLFVAADGTPARMTWALVDDTIRGRFAFDADPSDTGFAIVGIRVSDSVVPLAPLNLSNTGPGSRVPMILIRLDDLPATDTGIVARMISRGLYGELAIPTALVAGPTRATWADVSRWVEAGFSVAAHSQHHRPIMSDQEFMAEVLGSIRDLGARGYDTRDFVQPGAWVGATNFDSIAKLRTWRGAIFQTFTRVFEAYERHMPVPLPLSDSMAMGMTHWTVSDGVNPVDILSWWHQAQQPGMFSVFLIHSSTLATPDTLDWFLDSIAVAVRSGRVRLAHSATDALTP